jgi:hypothetical protein
MPFHPTSSRTVDASGAFPRQLCLLALSATCGSLASGSAIYEGFTDYPAESSVLAQSGGTGFTGIWSPRSTLTGSGGSIPGESSAIVKAESLSYSDGERSLVTNGGRLFLTGEFGSANLARTVDLDALPHTGEDPKLGKRTYLSFLARREGEPADPSNPVFGGNYPWGDNLYPRAAGVNLFSDNDGDILALLIGNQSNKSDDVWRITGEDIYGDERRDARSTVPFGSGEATHLIVMRIDHGGGGWHGDRLRVWVDPLLASEAANQPPLTFDWTQRDDPLYVQPAFLGLEAGDGSGNRPHAELSFDEFRIGDSWESVTPHTGGDNKYGRPLTHDGFLATGEGFLGWLSTTDTPWSYSWSLQSWVYLPGELTSDAGTWFYFDPR